MDDDLLNTVNLMDELESLSSDRAVAVGQLTDLYLAKSRDYHDNCNSDEPAKFIRIVAGFTTRMAYVLRQLYIISPGDYRNRLFAELTVLQDLRKTAIRNFKNVKECNFDSLLKNYKELCEVFHLCEIGLIRSQGISTKVKAHFENSIFDKNDIEVLDTNNELPIISESSYAFDLVNDSKAHLSEISNMTFRLNEVLNCNAQNIGNFENKVTVEEESLDFMFDSDDDELTKKDVLEESSAVKTFIKKVKAIKEVPLQVKIPSYHCKTTCDDFHYQFCVKVKISGFYYVLWRRYSSFLRLHTELSAREPMIYNLNFPSKKYMGSFDSTFLNVRRQQLEDYLNSLFELIMNNKLRKMNFQNGCENMSINLVKMHDFFDPTILEDEMDSM